MSFQSDKEGVVEFIVHDSREERLIRFRCSKLISFRQGFVRLMTCLDLNVGKLFLER